MAGQGPRRTSTPRWGLRTLAFLALAAAAIMTSNVMYARGEDTWVLLTSAGTVIGLVGAAVCTVRGVRAVTGSGSRRR